MVTKGAVEEMLQVCTFAEYKNNVEPLTNEVKQEILETVKKFKRKRNACVGSCTKK